MEKVLCFNCLQCCTGELFLFRYSVSTSLGETVVSFDFASPIDYIPNQNLFAKHKPEAIQLQPIYLLQGNGDVLLLLTSLNDNK